MGRHALARRGADTPPPSPERVAHPRRLTWNTDYGGFFTLWTGSGEAEALGELFFDNLATLLSVTDLMLGFFLSVLIGNAADGPAPAPPHRFEAPRALEEAARSNAYPVRPRRAPIPPPRA